MRGIAQPLHLVERRRLRRLRGDVADHDAAARGADASHLGDGCAGPFEVMQREARDDDVEGPVRERQRVGVAGDELDVAQAERRRARARPLEHGVDEVEPDRRSRRGGERAGHDARAAGDVEHVILRADGAGPDEQCGQRSVIDPGRVANTPAPAA